MLHPRKRTHRQVDRESGSGEVVSSFSGIRILMALLSDSADGHRTHFKW